MTAAVALEGVERRFPDGTQALAGISLAIAAESFVALLGPSGCGKSTVLRLVAGLDTASSGSVRRDGGTAVGFVFQEPTLMPWATVSDNVWLPLRLAGVDRDEAKPRIDALLERVGLAAFSAAYPAQLSGGMKMRASIARALVTNPPLLLMDEPFAALDEITRQRLNDDLLALWQQQRFTAIFVTHSVFEAVYLSQRVVVMSARPGRIAADVTIEAPLPRGPAFRASARYAALCADVSAALEKASAA